MSVENIVILVLFLLASVVELVRSLRNRRRLPPARTPGPRRRGAEGSVDVPSRPLPPARVHVDNPDLAAVRQPPVAVATPPAQQTSTALVRPSVRLRGARSRSTSPTLRQAFLWATILGPCRANREYPD